MMRQYHITPPGLVQEKLVWNILFPLWKIYKVEVSIYKKKNENSLEASWPSNRGALSIQKKKPLIAFVKKGCDHHKESAVSSMLYPANRIVVSKNLYVRNISVLALFGEVDSRINGRINV
jgi:hypothetical protein